MRQTARWLAKVQRDSGPIYLNILGAIEAAIRSGDLQPGDQLPPQRHVAEALGVDMTTVTRAYTAARKRGWVEGAVGRGTFITGRGVDDDPGRVDLSMNLPPPPSGVSLGSLLGETTSKVLQRNDPARLMAYHPGAGSLAQQAAGASWLAPCVGEIKTERVLVTSGAQTALAAILNTICAAGDRIIVEPLTYPGFRHLARRFGVTLVPCPVDQDGFLPEELERICREQSPAAIYLVPTIQNPTAATTSLSRRRDIAQLALAEDIWIIEDDPYSRLLAAPPAALATFAHEKTFYLATLAKCLSPGLRLAYLVCPTARMTADLAANLRAIVLMPPPIMAAIVTNWIRDGSAENLLTAVRREAYARRQIAREILPQAGASAEESIHVWLDLPSSWPAESLNDAAQARGLSLVTAEAFATGPDHRNGVRISLGGPQSREVLAAALQNIADLLGRPRGPLGAPVV